MKRFLLLPFLLVCASVFAGSDPEKDFVPIPANPDFAIVFVKFCKMKSPEKADAEQLSFEERRLCSAGTAVRRNVTRLQF